LLAPRQLIFTALEGALLNPHSRSFSGAEEARAEVNRRQIPYVLLTSRTRAEIEPLRRELEHRHPFITESGGGVFIPDGYFNLRIPGAQRCGRYLCVAVGKSYREVAAALDEIAQECGIGVAGFHHMNAREVAQNTRLRPREAELARDREFDEPFFFTSADERAIARFVTAAGQRGFQARRGSTFWRFSSGCDTASAVRLLTRLFRQNSYIKLRTVGIGSAAEDLHWLQVVDDGVLLPSPEEEPNAAAAPDLQRISVGEVSGPAGWNSVVLGIIGET
jgi:mannosyl-3-phosphoglycerate phosphatase